jgi:GNAT superfamily N-acetyltransferase
MSITVTTFDSRRHLDAAAKLLATRHARDRARDPRFPARFDDATECRAMIENEANEHDAFGVAAESGGDVIAFAIMAPFLVVPTHYTANFFVPRSAQLGYGAHAAAEGMELDAYREMYAVLAAHFVERGIFDHLAYIAPRDAAVNEAFVSLGFGRALTCAIRDVSPVEAPATAGIEMHLASAEDAAVIAKLNDDLAAHHAASPIYWAHVREADASAQEHQRTLLESPDANAHWVAYDHGKPVGMNTFMPPDWISPMLQPDKLVYLYQGIVAPEARRGGVGATILRRGIEWARDHGYEHVALHFASPNVPGARFWQSQGFVPVEHRMARHIDERVAWAH